MPAIYEDTMSDRELGYIESILERESVGYFRTLLMIAIIAGVLVLITGVIANFATPQENEKFSLSEFVIASIALFVFLLGVAVWGKKRLSAKYKKDMKSKLKIVVPTLINKKQIIPATGTCHFHLNDPKLLSIEVDAKDFQMYAVGDMVNIEFAKFSRTYLGYY